MELRRSSPTCPKCGGHHTFDIIPELPNEPNIQMQPLDPCVTKMRTISIGNAKYYCLDCGHKWKKYRGQKPYQRIKKIHAYSGSIPGPFFQKEIDLQKLSPEDKSWFLEELYKCDFLNWAEEYMMPYVLDGEYWTLHIEFDTYCEIKRGENHYPPKWEKFCKAIEKVTNSDFH